MGMLLRGAVDSGGMPLDVCAILQHCNVDVCLFVKPNLFTWLMICFSFSYFSRSASSSEAPLLSAYYQVRVQFCLARSTHIQPTNTNSTIP